MKTIKKIILCTVIGLVTSSMTNLFGMEDDELTRVQAEIQRLERKAARRAAREEAARLAAEGGADNGSEHKVGEDAERLATEKAQRKAARKAAREAEAARLAAEGTADNGDEQKVGEEDEAAAKARRKAERRAARARAERLGQKRSECKQVCSDCCTETMECGKSCCRGIMCCVRNAHILRRLNTLGKLAQWPLRVLCPLLAGEIVRQYYFVNQGSFTNYLPHVMFATCAGISACVWRKPIKKLWTWMSS